VGVGAVGAQQALGYQLEGRPPRRQAVLAGDRLRVDLTHRAPPQLTTQPRGAVEDRVGASLGMRDHNAEATVAQLVSGGVKVPVDRLEGGLDQEPARMRRALGDGVELSLRESADHVVAQFAPAEQADGKTGLLDGRLQLADPLGQVRDLGHEVAADVGRGHDRAGALRGGGAHEVQAVCHRRGTVVHAGEGVEVQLYAVHEPQLRRTGTITGHVRVTGVWPFCERGRPSSPY